MSLHLLPRLSCHRSLVSHVLASSTVTITVNQHVLNVDIHRHFHGYNPKDEFRARQEARSQRWRDKRLKSLIKSGMLVVVGASMCISGLVYYSMYNIHDSYSFFPDLSQLERGSESYIPVRREGDEGHSRKRRKKRKVILFPWLQSHSNDLWTLLKLCQSDDRSTRHLGVQAIAEQRHWSDGEYRMAAQAMDSRTMIGLARTAAVDHRLFLPPPRIPPGQDDLETQLRHLLSKLPTHDLDLCTKYFTSNALMEGSQPSTEEREMLWTFDGNDFLKVEPDTSKKEDVKNEMFFLLALKGHSQLSSHCPLIVELGGLQVMRRIHDARSNSIKIMRQIARVLANLSLYQGLHSDIINAGWVSILAKWIQSDDFALRLHATKALANLDRDFGETRLYPDSVYLYYPQCRYRQPVYADVIFIHGLLGGPFRTWRQNDCMRPKKQSKDAKAKETCPEEPERNQADILHVDDNRVSSNPQTNISNTQEDPPYSICWPQDWLAKDCPHIRIMTVEYETHLSEWAPRCPYESEKRTVQTRSRELLDKLQRAGVGDRPIIWVGHSMGGLLIKEMLLLAKETQSTHNIIEHSKGIVFYSVPHRGSPLAAYSNHSKFLLYPSVEVKELHQGSEALLKLHQNFTDLMFDVGIPLLSFAEGLKTNLPLNLKVMIVPNESSDPGFGELHVMKHLNHLNVCKPISKDSRLYQLTLEFIRDCIPQNRVDHILRANIPEDYIFPDDLGEDSRGTR